jgi:hypothetical protein
MTLRWCALLGLLHVATIARADGVMTLRDRELFRVGAPARGYCAAGASVDECDQIKTKVLSGYDYLRGQLSVGVTANPKPHAVAALRISVASGALPGGDITVGTVEGALSDPDLRRLRLTLLDAKGLFVCHDAHSGRLVAPVTGMFSSECLPNASMAFDAGLGTLQWDLATEHLSSEWLHAGPAWELLANGLGQAHLLRSVMIGLPFDLRSTLHGAGGGSPTSLGVGVRLDAFYRTPHWETRLELQHRTALAGGAGLRHDNALQGELRLLHNFFLTDAVVVQAGLSLRGVWAQRPRDAFVVWAAVDRRWQGYAGIYVGWLYEPPPI